MKRLDYRFAPTARFEYRDILIWLCDERPGRDDKFVVAVETLAERLCIFPELGKSMTDLSNDFRMIPIWEYLIFYTIHADHIRIERVLHGARDIHRVFDDEV